MAAVLTKTEALFSLEISNFESVSMYASNYICLVGN